MIDKVIRTVEKYQMLPEGGRVIAALSGGSDSMAMLTALLMLRERYSFTLEAAHVNHCLRGEQADSDERFVRDFCEKQGIKLHVLRADVAAEAKKNGEGLEEAGRRVRYAFFDSLGEDAVIATAHNLSDKVETFLFNFARGSALRGLCSIPAVRGRIIRPIIDCTKDEILRFCKENSIEFVTDATNSDIKYSRNRIRHTVIPQLKSVNPAFERSAGGCMELLAQDEELLTQTARSLLESARRDGGCSAQVLAEAHPSLARRALAMTLEENTGVTPEREAVERLLSLLKTGGSAQINGGVTVRVRHGLIEFPAEELPDLPELELVEGEFTFGGARVTARIIHRRETNNLQNLSKQVLEYRLDYDKIQGKPILRGRRAGDRLSLKARGCTKSLKKLFNELAIPPEERNGRIVLADGGGVLFAEGIGCASRVCVTDGTENILLVTIKR